MNRLLTTLAPSVPRAWLRWVAGATWTAVGAMLLVRAALWLSLLPASRALSLVLVGAAAAWWLAHRAFLPLAERNLERLAGRPEKSCVFGVFPWRSWLMVIVMIAMGVSLRRFVPPVFLIAPYVCMGFCLWAGAMRYFGSHRLRGA